MQGFLSFQLNAGDYIIIVHTDAVQITWHDAAPPLADDLLTLADAVWAQKPDHVFNAPLLIHQKTTVHENGLHLTAYFSEYRFYYAQKQSGTSFGLTPIGVSGLIICEDHVIFARRASHVTSYPDMLELVPAGGLDDAALREDGTVDFAAQIRAEFAEETGQSKADIAAGDTLRPDLRRRRPGL